jgi:hypothetical protein
MAAAARSEARRRAILARGNDRLAKLTASARGEDATTYMHDGDVDCTTSTIFRSDERLAFRTDQRDSGSFPGLSAFIGEESDMQVPSRPAPIVDSSPWSEEQQKQFLEALMGASTPSFQPRALHSANVVNDSSTRTESDPLTSLMSKSQTVLSVNSLVNELGVTAPMRRRKLLPLIHLVTIWVLVAYFVFFQEPKAFQTHGTTVAGGQWRRWAKLGSASAKAIDFLEIQVVVRWPVLSTSIINLHFMKAILLGVCVAPGCLAYYSHSIQICEHLAILTFPRFKDIIRMRFSQQDCLPLSFLISRPQSR